MLANPELDDIHGYYFEDLSVGMSASYAKTITETDIVLFAGISGDVNPVHLNQEFASDTMFEGRIAHGMLTASFISTFLGTKLPGPGCIYLRQDLRFLAPVRPGDTVQPKSQSPRSIPSESASMPTPCAASATSRLSRATRPCSSRSGINRRRRERSLHKSVSTNYGIARPWQTVTKLRCAFLGTSAIFQRTSKAALLSLEISMASIAAIKR